LDNVSAITLSTSIYIAWATGGMIGYNMGAMIANPEAWGLDFALPAMFVALLIFACKNKVGVIAAVIGGTTAVCLHLLNVSNGAIFLSALAGATIGVFFYKKEGVSS
jgi:predicted branched-subunit amino acid permease